MKERRHAKDARRRIELEALMACDRIGNEIAMGQHRALRRAGRSRRIEKQTNVVGQYGSARRRRKRLDENTPQGSLRRRVAEGGSTRASLRFWNSCPLVQIM